MELCPGSGILPEVPVSPPGIPVPGIQYRLYLATEWASKELARIVFHFVVITEKTFNFLNNHQASGIRSKEKLVELQSKEDKLTANKWLLLNLQQLK